MFTFHLASRFLYRDCGSVTKDHSTEEVRTEAHNPFV